MTRSSPVAEATTPANIAEWMRQEFEKRGFLAQIAAVRGIMEEFGGCGTRKFALGGRLSRPLAGGSRDGSRASSPDHCVAPTESLLARPVDRYALGKGTR